MVAIDRSHSASIPHASMRARANDRLRYRRSPFNRDDGLIVIGVHTPEFSFEHEIDLVSQAIKERTIDYPVPSTTTTRSGAPLPTTIWPALYFVDADGMIRDQHVGGGRYEESQLVIQRLLGVEREPACVEGLEVEAAADWDHLYTPETYLGYARREHFASANGTASGERRPSLPGGRARASEVAGGECPHRLGEAGVTRLAVRTPRSSCGLDHGWARGSSLRRSSAGPRSPSIRCP